MKKMRTALVSLGTLAAFGSQPGPAHAVEGAVGFYLLGSKTTMAGYLPPPGTYFLDYNYYYSGSTDFSLEIAGLTLDGGVEADAYWKAIPAF